MRRRKKKIYVETLGKIFDIWPCKHMIREECDCLAPQKVPETGFSFLIKQRTVRKILIFTVDNKVTETWEKARKEMRRRPRLRGKNRQGRKV